MADDNIKVTQEQIAVTEQLTSVTNAKREAYAQSGKAARQSAAQEARAMREAGREARNYKNTLGPTIKEVNALADAQERLDTMNDKLSKHLKKAAREGRSQSLAHIMAIKSETEELKRLLAQAGNVEEKLKHLTDEYKTWGNQLDKANEGLKKQEKKTKDLNTEIAKLGAKYKDKALPKYKEAHAKLSKELEISKIKESEFKKEIIDTTDKMTNQEPEIAKAAKSYGEYTEAVTRSTKAIVDEAREKRKLNRENIMMKGGIGAAGAYFNEIADSKLWGTLEKFASGAMIGVGLKHFGDAISGAVKQTATLSKVSDQLDISLGNLGQRKGAVESFTDAQTAMKSMAQTAGDLGMKMEDVSAIADKMRIGARVDAEGKLSADAVNKLTREIAFFSKITGVDATAASDMITTRMHKLGMTSDQAAADLKNMRVILGQMTMGMKNNNILMDDMVNLINDASAASQSYIVDTRLMTQALRAAATQSLNLSQNQKLAKDTAATMGKVMSETPDFIAVPWANKLAQKLAAEGETYIQKFDVNTQKILRTYYKGIKDGSIEMNQAGRLMIETVGSTSEGMEEKFKTIFEAGYLNSPVAARLLKQWGLAASEPAAQVLITQLKEAKKQQGEMLTKWGYSLNLTEIMADNTGKIKEALAGASTEAEKMAKLKEFGLNAEDGDLYLSMMKKSDSIVDGINKKVKTGVFTQIQGENLIADERKRSGAELLNFMSMMSDPIKKAGLELSKMSKGTEFKAKIEHEFKMSDLIKELKSQGKTDEEARAEIIERFGIKSEENLKQLDEMIEKDATVSKANFSNFISSEQNIAKEQDDKFNNMLNKFQEGILSGLDNMLNYFIPWFKTSWGGIVKAIAEVGIGIAGLAIAGPLMLSKGVFLGLAAYGSPSFKGAATKSFVSKIFGGAGGLLSKFGGGSKLAGLAKGSTYLLGALGIYESLTFFSKEVTKTGSVVKGVKESFKKNMGSSILNLTKGVLGVMAFIPGLNLVAGVLLGLVYAGEYLAKAFGITAEDMKAFAEKMFGAKEEKPAQEKRKLELMTRYDLTGAEYDRKYKQAQETTEYGFQKTSVAQMLKKEGRREEFTSKQYKEIEKRAKEANTNVVDYANKIKRGEVNLNLPLTTGLRSNLPAQNISTPPIREEASPAAGATTRPTIQTQTGGQQGLTIDFRPETLTPMGEMTARVTGLPQTMARTNSIRLATGSKI